MCCVQGLQCSLEVDAALVQLAAVQQCAWFLQALLGPTDAAPQSLSPAGDHSPTQHSVAETSLPLSMSHADPAGSGFLSTQAYNDLSTSQPETPCSTLNRLKSGGSLGTAASTAQSLAALKSSAMGRWLRLASVSLQHVQCSAWVGPADELSICFDGGVSDVGRSASVHSLLLKLNGCTFVEARELEIRSSITPKQLQGMDDLTAQA